MKTRLLLCTCAISIVAFTAGTAYSCGQNPVASFTVNPYRVCINGVVSFNASASYDPDETTLSYSWSFGAGAYAITGATTASPTCKYSSPGEKTVTLTVTDNDDPEYCGGQPGCADKSDSISSYPLTVVKVDKIQYWNPDTLYTDITETLYICVGSTVPFRAVPDPSTSYWPTGKPVWGGTAGASGSGIGIKSVAFNTLSSTLSDYKTVTAECGNTVTVNVIVYDFQGLLCPQDGFEDRSESRYGIEEKVDLLSDITPSGLTATQIGGLQWTLLYGVGELSAVTLTGTAVYDAGPSAGEVTFVLVVVSGPSMGAGLFDPYDRTIIAPSGTRMTRIDPRSLSE